MMPALYAVLYGSEGRMGARRSIPNILWRGENDCIPERIRLVDRNRSTTSKSMGLGLRCLNQPCAQPLSGEIGGLGLELDLSSN